MARFYFHFFDGAEVHHDTLGVELQTTEEAYLEAYKGAVDIWGEFIGERRDPRPCAFEVANGRGEPLFSLPFVEIIETCANEKSGRVPHGHKLLEVHFARTRRSHAAFQEALNDTRATLRETDRLVAAMRG